jgi:hypothetical protein
MPSAVRESSPVPREVDDSSIQVTSFATALSLSSLDRLRPLGSCSRAAGWRAATSCFGPSKNDRIRPNVRFCQCRCYTDVVDAVVETLRHDPAFRPPQIGGPTHRRSERAARGQWPLLEGRIHDCSPIRLPKPKKPLPIGGRPYMTRVTLRRAKRD